MFLVRVNRTSIGYSENYKEKNARDSGLGESSTDDDRHGHGNIPFLTDDHVTGRPLERLVRTEDTDGLTDSVHN